MIGEEQENLEILAQREGEMSEITKINNDGAIKIADRIREMIKHENELINHRVTWLLVIQGFSYTAVGVAWDSKFPLPNVLFLLIVAGANIAAYLRSRGSEKRT